MFIEEKIQEWLKIKREQVQFSLSSTESQFLLKLLNSIATVQQLSTFVVSLICSLLTIPGETRAACETGEGGGGDAEAVGKTEGD